MSGRESGVDLGPERGRGSEAYDWEMAKSQDEEITDRVSRKVKGFVSRVGERRIAQSVARQNSLVQQDLVRHSHIYYGHTYALIITSATSVPIYSSIMNSHLCPPRMRTAPLLLATC